MIVEELINELKKMPTDATVIIIHPDLRGSGIKHVAFNDDDLGKDKVKIYIR